MQIAALATSPRRRSRTEDIALLVVAARRGRAGALRSVDTGVGGADGHHRGAPVAVVEELALEFGALSFSIYCITSFDGWHNVVVRVGTAAWGGVEVVAEAGAGAGAVESG